MELYCFKPLWGHQGRFIDACVQACNENFQGLEGQVPEQAQQRLQWRDHLQTEGLAFIAEICTAGSYVPDRSASLGEHLDDFAKKLDRSLALNPLKINCLGGCDAWPEEESARFFSEAMDLASQAAVSVSFETHRGRSLFNPWTTGRLCRVLPSLQLTADFSHWCVVCERLLDEEAEGMTALFERVQHIHGRVGYEQGAQVGDPRGRLSLDALQAHQRWWRKIWQQQFNRGDRLTTLTPEFGPDGYQMIDPDSEQAIGDLWTYNCWMAQTQRQQFAEFSSTQNISGEP